MSSQPAPFDQSAELRRVLQQLEARTDLMTEFQIFAQIQGLAARVREAGQEPSPELRAESLAFHFNEDLSGNGSGWDTYYGPVMSGADASGKRVDVPSLDSVTPDVLAYWSGRAQESTHPVLRGRYGDLIWDLASKVPGVKRDQAGARIAIESAIEIADRKDVACMVGRTKLTRALRLARSLKDDKLVTRVRNALLAFMQRTAEDDKAGTWVYVHDLLLKESIPLDAGQEDIIITDLEDRLRRLAGLDDDEHSDPWGARAAAERLADFYRRTNRPDDVRRVLLASGAAFERLARSAMPLVGAMWMQDVYELYREFGMTEEARALDPLLAELGERAKGNLKRMTHSIEIPNGVFDEIARAVVAGTLAESLNRVAGRYVVDPDQAQQEVLRLAQKAPVQAIFSLVHVDARGRPESKIGGVEEDLQGRVIAQMGQTIAIQAIFIRHALKTVFEQFTPTAETLTGHVYASPVFEDTSRDLIRRAMQAYVDGDWPVFAHLIVPQIEQALQALVVMQGGSHLAPNRHGGLNLRSLDDLLREKSVSSVLGIGVVGYLQAVLSDVRGLNLRNAICHGLLPAEQFGPTMADRLFHVVLLLALIRGTPATSESEPEGPPT